FHERCHQEGEDRVPERPHPELEGRAPRFGDLPLRVATDSFSLMLIGLIAGTVFFSTVTAYIYTITSTEMQHFGDEAFREQVNLVERITESSVVTISDLFESGAAVLATQVRCSTATQRESFSVLAKLGFASVRNEKDFYCN